MHWFTREWWQYLLAPNSAGYISRIGIIWCRMRGHPAGPWWFNVGGTEPDMHCKNCGDEI